MNRDFNKQYIAYKMYKPLLVFNQNIIKLLLFIYIFIGIKTVNTLLPRCKYIVNKYVNNNYLVYTYYILWDIID